MKLLQLMKLGYSTRLILFFSAMIFAAIVLLGAGVYVLPQRIAKIGEGAEPFGEATQNIQRQIEEQLPAMLPQNTEPSPPPIAEEQVILPDEETAPQESEPIVEIPEEAIR